MSRLWLLATVPAVVACVSDPARAAANRIEAPAQPVRQAIVEFARQTGVQVLALEEDLRGKVTAPVSGVYTPREALTRMLTGTGLMIRSDNGRTITLARALPPMRPPVARASSPALPASPPATPVSANLVESMVVTGSHISRSGFNAPSPITVIGARGLEQLALTNIGVALNELPALRADLTPNTNGFANFNIGAVIANLRGLGAPRTLVLVNGHRFTTSTREGSVDMNLIPTIMIDRTEIVTGGASAAYGSDAVAGAINIVLNTRMTGLRGQVSAGETEHGDGRGFQAALAGGTDFAEGRGHIVLGGEYETSGKIGNCFTRSWCTAAGVAVNLPGPTHDDRAPANLVVASQYGRLNMTLGGVIPATAANPAALRNMQFDAGGNLVPYNPGNYRGGGFSVSPDNYSNLLDANLAVPVKRYNVFSHVDYELSPKVSAFLEGSYAYVDGSNVGNQTQDLLIGIKRDNAFAPPALKAFFAANPTVDRINIGRLGNDLGLLTGDSHTRTWRAAVGLKGDFGAGWTWNLFYDRGRNNRVQSVANNRVNANFYGADTNPASPNYRAGGAVDAVLNPANGQIVCRSTIDPADPAYNPASACVPLNLFGYAQSSAAARAYVNRTNTTLLNFGQEDASAGVEGRLFRTWAGPIAVAGGVDYRRNTIKFVNDPVGDAFGYYYNYGASYAGSVAVVEAYGETEIPLASNQAWAEALNLNLAGRKTDYHNANTKTGRDNRVGVTSWKVSLVHDVTDWLRLRATRSRDIRAANFNELYATGQAAFLTVLNPWLNVTDLPNSITGGNVNLRPETGDTYTLGAVLRPGAGWLQGFRASVDYYRISLKGAVGALSAAQLVNDCFANGPRAQSCSRIVFQSGYGSNILEIDRTNENLNSLRQSGVDIEAEYSLPMSRLLPRADGKLSFHMLASYVAHQVTTAGTITIDRAGMTGPFAGFGDVGAPGVPRWTVSGTMSYDRGPFSATLQGRFISKGMFSASLIGPDDPAYNINLANSVDNNVVPSRVYFNLSTQYDLPARRGFKAQAFASISNLFDKAPPLAPGLIGYSEPAFFDMVGRTFRVGLRFDY